MNSRARLDSLRLALGLFLTPAIVPITSIVIAFAVTKEHQGDCPYGWLAGLTILIGLPASYICATVFGIPYVLIMQKIGHLNFWTTMAGTISLWAGLFGLLGVALLCARGQPGVLFLPGVLAILYLPGMLLASAAFYRIALR